jgi:hypothetical protein
MKEQIKEIAKVLCEKYDTEHCKVCDHHGRCMVRLEAEWIYEAGYRKQSAWISVDDRMPTECENVLCFEKGKVYVAFLENAEYSAVWWDWVDYDRDDTWTERTPTHWMPLPQPPKMKGGAE